MTANNGFAGRFSMERKDAVAENPLFPHCLPAVPQRFFFNWSQGEYVVGVSHATTPPGLLRVVPGSRAPQTLAWTWGTVGNDMCREPIG